MTKKILLTASRFFPYAFGGGEVYIASVASELRRRGWKVKIAALGNIQDTDAPFRVEEYIHNEVEVSALCFHQDALTELEKYAGVSAHHHSFLQNEIEKFSPDIIHINGLSLPALTVAKEKSISTVMTVHHSGVVCPAGDLVRPNNSLCNYAEDPSVCIPCTSLIRKPRWYTGGIFGRTPRWLYSRIGKRTEHTRRLSFPFRVVRYPWLVEQEIVHNKKIWDQVQTIIVPSHAIKTLLLRNAVENRKIIVLPHGVAISRLKQAKETAVKPVKLGFVGQIARHKGVHLMFEALQSLNRPSDYEVHLFGDARTAEEKEYFKKFRTQYSKVTFQHHGFIPHHAIHTAYEQVDVVIVPSLAYEAFCLVVHEAFACSTPVIVTRSGAMPELVEHGKNGMIVERNDASSLAHAIRSLLDMPSLIRQFQSHIPRVKNFSEYTEELEQIYRERVL